MEKEIGKIKKNEITDIVVRIDDFGGKKGLTIREYVKGDRYTGFTKAGTRISAENFLAFRELINSINLEDLEQEKAEEKEEKETKSKRGRKKKEKAEQEEAKEGTGQEEQETLEESEEEKDEETE